MSDTSILYKIFRVWHVAQLVTCLLHKHEDLTSDTQLPRKKVGTAGSLELAGHSLAKSVYPRISERLSQNTQWREWLRQTTDPLWLPYAQVLFMHANTFLTSLHIHTAPNHPLSPVYNSSVQALSNYWWSSNFHSKYYTEAHAVFGTIWKVIFTLLSPAVHKAVLSVMHKPSNQWLCYNGSRQRDASTSLALDLG